MTRAIVDTHVHIWDLQKAAYPWLEGDESVLNRSYSIDELEREREEAGVTTGILVQAAGNSEDTALMFDTAARSQWVKGVVAWLPLTDPAATAAGLERYSAKPLFKGVRHQVHDEADPRWLLQPAVTESLQLLAAKDIPYDMVGIIPDHIETVLKLAERVPALRIVFDHLNQPPVASGERFGRWGELMKAASRHSQLYAKISGLGTTTGKGAAWTADDIRPYVAFALGQFGTDRCMLGGDWPVSLLAGSYAGTWKKYLQLIGELLEEKDAEKIVSTNASAFYKL